MPTFSTLPPPPPPIAPGTYLGKIATATERTSANGNPMIVMTIELPPPDRQRLPCVVTFVPAARALVNALAASADLLRPSEPDVEVELSSHHLLNRYIYFRVEHDEDGAPRITRFIDRQVALAANPRLAEVAIQPQAPIALPIVRKPSL